MTIEQFRDGLRETGLPVYHILAAVEAEPPVLCWQELPGTVASGDNAPVAIVLAAQVDYFTATEYDPAPLAVEITLSTLGVSWTKEAITYDPDRAEWRHIWRCQFFGG